MGLVLSLQKEALLRAPYTLFPLFLTQDEQEKRQQSLVVVVVVVVILTMV